MSIENFKLFSDVMSALSLSNQAIFSSRKKHIATKCRLFRESADKGRLIANHVLTTLQLSDMLANNLPKPTFLRLREMAQAFNTNDTTYVR